ncbi:DsrE family protein [Candidatus Nitrospira allomarina]|jgi:predicted peroxiredoxin|uniref:DsrE family protein n=1 Tax=Candidatus Nitrospira allomarina TaxID=3020900 RepID=A0AA96JWZ9_9BACT|nr:DsrE family protein [Candidatus Nitrospira allomarina]WNM58486.1 DsrE family protein [Candidatus Nitrospira allomarina]
MARFVIAGSKGTDDPTMATLPFIASQEAHKQGHEVVLWLQAEAVVLAKKGVVDGVQGIGLPALKVLANTILSQGIPLWVCSACAIARQIHESDLEVGAVMKGMQDYVKAVAERDRNLSF